MHGICSCLIKETVCGKSKKSLIFGQVAISEVKGVFLTKVDPRIRRAVMKMFGTKI